MLTAAQAGAVPVTLTPDELVALTGYRARGRVTC